MNTMGQMIEISQQEDNTYKFYIKTESGQLLLTSRGVKSMDKIEQMTDLLKGSDKMRLLFERKTNHQGKFLFNIKDKNGQLLGTSELYNSEAGMENGIKNLKIRIATL
ncbi:MAG: YegP family protein [Aurantibacter sp.]